MFVHYNSEYPANELLILIVYTLAAAFFALRIDTDPEECLAIDVSDTIFVKGASEDKYFDVGYRYRMVFEIIFFTNLA